MLNVILLFIAALAGVDRASAADTQPQVRTNRGPALFQQQRFSDAAAIFAEDLKRDPNNAEALYYLGRIAFQENRISDAVHYLELATRATPNSSVAFHWLGRAYGMHARDLGIPRGFGPARRTKKALEKAVALDGDNVAARLDLATFCREAPGIVGGSKRTAIAQIEEITRRDPCLGAIARGDMALAEKRFDDAERWYRGAIELDGKRTDAHFSLGILCQQTKRYDQAFDAFEKTLQLSPEEKRALFYIGKTADLSGQRLDRGEEALKAYLQCHPYYLMPKLSWAHRRLGNIYLKKGMRQAAREQYLAALRVAPDDKEAADALKHLDASAQ